MCARARVVVVVVRVYVETASERLQTRRCAATATTHRHVTDWLDSQRSSDSDRHCGLPCAALCPPHVVLWQRIVPVKHVVAQHPAALVAPAQRGLINFFMGKQLKSESRRTCGQLAADRPHPHRPRGGTRRGTRSRLRGRHCRAARRVC